MEKPKVHRKEMPYCHEQMLYLIYEAGGSITRGDLREKLLNMGYTYYCVYEAFRRLTDQEKITFTGSGHTPKQLVSLKEMID